MNSKNFLPIKILNSFYPNIGLIFLNIKGDSHFQTIVIADVGIRGAHLAQLNKPKGGGNEKAHTFHGNIIFIHDNGQYNSGA